MGCGCAVYRPRRIMKPKMQNFLLSNRQLYTQKKQAQIGQFLTSCAGQIPVDVSELTISLAHDCQGISSGGEIELINSAVSTFLAFNYPVPSVVKSATDFLREIVFFPRLMLLRKTPGPPWNMNSADKTPWAWLVFSKSYPLFQPIIWHSWSDLRPNFSNTFCSVCSAFFAILRYQTWSLKIGTEFSIRNPTGRGEVHIFADRFFQAAWNSKVTQGWSVERLSGILSSRLCW